MNQEKLQNQVEKLNKQTELLNLPNHKTLHDNIIVVPLDVEEPGVTSRAVQFEDRPEIGLVVSVGPDVTGVEVGNVVFYGKYSTSQLTYAGNVYIIFKEEDVYCVAETSNG